MARPVEYVASHTSDEEEIVREPPETSQAASSRDAPLTETSVTEYGRRDQDASAGRAQFVAVFDAVRDDVLHMWREDDRLEAATPRPMIDVELEEPAYDEFAQYLENDVTHWEVGILMSKSKRGEWWNTLDMQIPEWIDDRVATTEDLRTVLHHLGLRILDIQFSSIQWEDLCQRGGSNLMLEPRLWRLPWRVKWNYCLEVLNSHLHTMGQHYVTFPPSYAIKEDFVQR